MHLLLFCKYFFDDNFFDPQLCLCTKNSVKRTNMRMLKYGSAWPELDLLKPTRFTTGISSHHSSSGSARHGTTYKTSLRIHFTRFMNCSCKFVNTCHKVAFIQFAIFSLLAYCVATSVPVKSLTQIYQKDCSTSLDLMIAAIPRGKKQQKNVIHAKR